jgi:hypothetical protein
MSTTVNFIEALQQVPDYRKSKGKRHQLWLVLLVIVLGSLCGYRGYRPLADFSQQHWQTLCDLVDLPETTRIPSYSTYRRVLQRVDFEPLERLFNDWSQSIIEWVEQLWVAIDGKSIKSTLSDYSQSYQNFVTTVSAFTHDSGVVLRLQVSNNKHTSEIEVVRQLIAGLSGRPIVFTLDALHCQKKRSSKLSTNSNIT